MAELEKPIVLITGAAGNIGRSLAKALGDRYRIVGLDLKDSGTDFPLVEVDFRSLPWNLALAALAALSLLFTRLTLGAEGGMANADHLIGALALTVISVAAAEVARPVRFLLMPLGAALFVTPFVYDTDGAATIASIIVGLLLIALSFRRGPIRGRYGSWNARIA